MTSRPILANILPAEAKATVPSTSRLLTPTTNTIPLLSTPSAQYYSYVHTLLIALYYYLRSSSLIHDPRTTLLWDLIPIAIAQSAFCAICLPSAGNWNSGTNGGKIIEGSAEFRKVGKANVKKKGTKASTAQDESGGSYGPRVMPTVFSLILTLTLPPIPLTVLALCLGAPLFPYAQIPHTMALAMHVSVVGLLPIFYTHGVSWGAWRDVAAAWLPFDDAGVWAGYVGCMVGGWVGAIPIALDWDREWQKWPCTVVWGMVMGWVAGRVLTNVLRLGIGVRINLSEKEEIPADMRIEKEESKKLS